MKQCVGCHTIKETTSFTKDIRKKDLLCSYCKECAKVKSHTYYEKNKDKIKKNILTWQEKNKALYKEKKKQWSLFNKEKLTTQKRKWVSLNKEKIKNIKRKYYLLNKDEINKRRSVLYKERRVKNPLFVIIDAARSRTYKIVKLLQEKGLDFYKEDLGSVDVYLGCSKKDYFTYLGSRFEEGMSWDNYGKKEGQWSIDHTIPLSSATSEKELLLLLHYTNTRPMWHTDNVSKGIKLQKETK